MIDWNAARIAEAAKPEFRRANGLEKAYGALLAEAEAALSKGPFSVTHKSEIPAGGDPHEFRSFAPYWWPDPANPDGPYLRRDGHINPECEDSKRSDRRRIIEMSECVATLALAWRLSGRGEFGERAAILLKTWFLDPAARMSPNLNFGQGIKGIVDGRGIGIIDTRNLCAIPDAVELLSPGCGWTAENTNALKQWFSKYLEWLLQSPHGIDEASQHNNHGTWFDVQAIRFSFFAGKPETARAILGAFMAKRVAKQVAPDGSQPDELARSRSLQYSLFNLEAYFMAAKAARRLGLDLLKERPQGAGSIKDALDFVAPYADSSKKWPYEQIAELKEGLLVERLLDGAEFFGDSRYAELAKLHRPEAFETARKRLTN